MYVSPALQEASPVAPAQAGDTLDVTRCHQMALCSRGGEGLGDVSLPENARLIVGQSNMGDVFRKKACPDPISANILAI